MFTVIIRMLAYSSQNMQMLIRNINQQIQEVEDVISSIRKMSEYDEEIRTLRIQLEEMNEQKRQLIDMMVSLNQIQKVYLQGERNITDYGEQINAINYYRSMDVISLGEVQNSIRDYHIV
ncbi:MAG: hypothetical protein ACRDBO_11655 [Lachnospiraceae bacterium]